MLAWMPDIPCVCLGSRTLNAYEMMTMMMIILICLFSHIAAESWIETHNKIRYKEKTLNLEDSNVIYIKSGNGSMHKRMSWE